jgi:hypothetical protein
MKYQTPKTEAAVICELALINSSHNLVNADGRIQSVPKASPKRPQSAPALGDDWRANP